MKVVPVPVQYASSLVNSYLNDFTRVGDLFEHDPLREESYRHRYEVIRRDYCTDRQKLVRILTEYNEKLGCSELTRENLRRLENAEATVVITGQQAGILTGPLYTIYKTITVIQLAQKMAQDLGKPVVPVFWVASEDHDYQEIDHLDFVSKEQEVMRLTLDFKPEGRFSVGHLPVTGAVQRLLDQLEDNTNPSEWKPEIMAKLRDSAANSDNLADWFAVVMTWLFRDYGLVLINPLNPELRRLWSAAFKRFLQQTQQVKAGLEAGMSRVRALGVEPQVETAQDHAHLFYYIKGERMPLFRQGDKFSVRGRDEQLTLEMLTAVAENNPELLSPNVVLRPVAQDVLLPIMAYVAGPGEISYYALYREIYPVFGQRMPIIFPRANITIVERGIAKNMEKYGVEFANGAGGLREKLEEILQAQDAVGIDRLFQNCRGQLEKLFEDLVQQVAVLDPQLSVHGSESLNKMLYQVEHFEKKTRQAHRKSCEMVIKRFRNLENQLFPRNNWQERVFNIVPYLFRYGTGLINELTETPLLGDTWHKLVYLGT